MADSPPPYPSKQDPRTGALKGLLNKLYDITKFWAGLGICLQLFLFVSGIAAIFVPVLTPKYPPVALPLALAGVLIGAKAAKCKGLAEKLKREDEFADGFGKPPSGPRLASLNVEFPSALKPELDALLTQGITYDSNLPCGTRRALENLAESAWFSQHLSAECARLLAWLFYGSLSLSMWLLYMCATELAGTPAGEAGAQGVAATLLFLISVGLYRNLAGYRSFSQRSEQVDSEARRMLSGGEPDLRDAMRLMAEYQVARSGAPLIPTWVWRIKRDHLNQQWALHKVRN